MSESEYPANKVYYAIGEVSRMTDVSISMLRTWEKEFDILIPKKNRKGDRFFTVNDIENIKLIRHLVKERGFKVAAAKRMLTKEYKATKEKQDALVSLKRVRDFMASLRDAIDQRAIKTKALKLEEPKSGELF
jgi:DNA-binding transcriptional MerR regulator